MKILCVNAGSSSLKFQLYEMPEEKVLINGYIEKIGEEDCYWTIKKNGEKIRKEKHLKNHTEAAQVLIEELLENKVVESLDEIKGVGHRVLHGGEKYSKSTIITEEVIKDIEELTKLGPLHHPGNLAGIRSLQKELPNTPMVAVFDTAYHQSMEDVSYIYPVPYAWYEKYGIRKYGFHGTSHRFIAHEVEKLLGRKEYNLISCHIGSGASLCAIKDGKCIDTSMGFTPLAGVMMGTRSGDIDPSIIPYVMEKEGKNVGEIIDDLNKNSGLVGLSEYSSDMRDILSHSDDGDEKTILARKKFVRRIVDYIAQYYVLLGGCDIIVFTAGIGENSIPIRREICEALNVLGVQIDLDANQKRSEFVKLSTDESKIQVYVIPTDEELMIARDTVELIRNGNY